MVADKYMKVDLLQAQIMGLATEIKELQRELNNKTTIFTTLTDNHGDGNTGNGRTGSSHHTARGPLSVNPIHILSSVIHLAN